MISGDQAIIIARLARHRAVELPGLGTTMGTQAWGEEPPGPGTTMELLGQA